MKRASLIIALALGLLFVSVENTHAQTITNVPTGSNTFILEAPGGADFRSIQFDYTVTNLTQASPTALITSISSTPPGIGGQHDLDNAVYFGFGAQYSAFQIQLDTNFIGANSGGVNELTLSAIQFRAPNNTIIPGNATASIVIPAQQGQLPPDFNITVAPAIVEAGNTATFTGTPANGGTFTTFNWEVVETSAPTTILDSANGVNVNGVGNLEVIYTPAAAGAYEIEMTATPVGSATPIVKTASITATAPAQTDRQVSLSFTLDAVAPQTPYQFTYTGPETCANNCDLATPLDFGTYTFTITNIPVDTSVVNGTGYNLVNGQDAQFTLSVGAGAGTLNATIATETVVQVTLTPAAALTLLKGFNSNTIDLSDVGNANHTFFTITAVNGQPIASLPAGTTLTGLSGNLPTNADSTFNFMSNTVGSYVITYRAAIDAQGAELSNLATFTINVIEPDYTGEGEVTVADVVAYAYRANNPDFPTYIDNNARTAVQTRYGVDVDTIYGSILNTLSNIIESALPNGIERMINNLWKVINVGLGEGEAIL
jgi:hypothetical protein